MASNDLSLTFVAFTMAYPPLPRFPPDVLPEFFAAIHQRHPFESFEQHSDVGATMDTEAARRLTITRDELRFQEYVDTHIDVVNRNVVDLITEVHKRFDRLRTFIVPTMLMRALWGAPPDSPPMSDFLRDRMVTLNDDQYKVLGEVGGLSLTLTGTSLAPDDHLHSHWDLEIGPYYRDESQLHIQLDNQFAYPTYKPDNVGEFLTASYKFLTERVVPFLNSLFENDGKGAADD